MAAATLSLSKGKIQELCERYLSERRPHLLNQSAVCGNGSLNFKILSYKLRPTSDAPSGFLGRHLFLRVDILLVDDDGKEKAEILRFFTKSGPTDVASRMEYLEEFGVFKKEILVYGTVLPQLEAIFPALAPKCYYAADNLLIFDDLYRQGYKMAADRDGLLNYEHLSCAVKTLASMHAASIIYEMRNGKKLPDMHAEAVVENAYPRDISPEHVRTQNFNNGTAVLLEIIKNLPKYTGHPLKAYILEEFPKQMAKIFPLAQTSTKYPNVFSHGDIWANNIMFKYGNFGEYPIECRYVDFQLSRYAPPMLDLITLLTIPTSRAFRQKYLDELLLEYYRAMSDILMLEEYCLNDILTQEQFDEGMREFRICGLIESCLFSHLTILPPAFTQSLTTSADGFSEFFGKKRVDICMSAFRSDTTYRERLTDMVEDLVDRFCLPETMKA